MNGLSFIRTKCNYSLAELADKIGVTRQMISAWENGRKEIPDARKKELSAFFGIEERFLGDITEADIKKLMHTAMYRFSDGKTERFHYGTDGSGEPMVIDDSMESLDEKLQRVKKEESRLLAEIKDKLHAVKADSIMDVVKQTEKGCELLEYVSSILDIMTEGSEHECMMKSYEIWDVMGAIMLANGRISMDGIEKKVYGGDSMLRISCFGVEKLAEAIGSNHDNYIEEYERIKKHVGEYSLALTYGISDITGIKGALEGKYDTFSADDCFTDIIALNCAALFISADSLSEEEYDVLNETFSCDPDIIVVFVGKPKVRLEFKHYTMKHDEIGGADMVRKLFAKIKREHEVYVKTATV